MRKAIEGAVYCTDCAGKLPHRTPPSLVLHFPASPPKSTCHGVVVEVYARYLPHVDDVVVDHKCPECHKLCEIKEEKGTCWGCGKEIMLYAAHKVVKK